MTGVAGDNQTAPKGASLPSPLSFTALGSDGLPIEGVTVTWSATPAGAAAFAPTSGPTNANGIASANVVLGTTLGVITMQASLAGVSPVTFHATVLDQMGIDAKRLEVQVPAFQFGPPFGSSSSWIEMPSGSRR